MWFDSDLDDDSSSDDSYHGLPPWFFPFYDGPSSDDYDSDSDIGFNVFPFHFGHHHHHHNRYHAPKLSQSEIESKLKRVKEEYSNYLELTEPELNRKTVAVLKDLCKAFNIKVTGKTKKADYVKAFVEFQQAIKNKEKTKEQMDIYHRGMVNYSLPPYTIIKILTYCWRSQYPTGKERERFQFRWQLSLLLLSKEFYKYVLTLYDTVDLCYARGYTPYSDNKCKLYQHIKSPYSSIKNIEKLRILDKDFSQVLDAAGHDYLEVFSNLRSITIMRSNGSFSSIFSKIANLPSLQSLKTIKIDSPFSVSQVKNVTKLKLLDCNLTPRDLPDNEKLTHLEVKHLNTHHGFETYMKKFPNLKVLGFDNVSTYLNTTVTEKQDSAPLKEYKFIDIFNRYLTSADCKIEVLSIYSWHHYPVATLNDCKSIHTIVVRECGYDGGFEERFKRLTKIFEEATPIFNIKKLVLFLIDPTFVTNGMDPNNHFIKFVSQTPKPNQQPSKPNQTKTPTTEAQEAEKAIIEKARNSSPPFQVSDYGWYLSYIQFNKRDIVNGKRTFKCTFKRLSSLNNNIQQ